LIESSARSEKNLKNKAGAIVAMNPNTGEILAMASSPAFDPNLFLQGVDKGTVDEHDLRQRPSSRTGRLQDNIRPALLSRS
jgi:penicillin-binding protein 2